MTTYDVELRGLRDAYAVALKSPVDRTLLSVLDELRGRALYAVASGGAFPAARLAARLHTERTSRPAVALTPLAYSAITPVSEQACLLLCSATARHPDAAFAAQTAIRLGHNVLLLTQRRADELDGTLAHPLVSTLTVPQPGGRDGFLATRSLLVSTVALMRLYGFGTETEVAGLPRHLPALESQGVTHDLRPRILVLYGPDEQAAADDIEARFSETGLASVQVADYRTFAHGRHYGLSRWLEETTVVALSGPTSRRLAERTTALLPDRAAVVRLTTDLPWPAGAIDLIVECMRLPIRPAASQGVELHRPGVGRFGRQLYHLSSSGIGASAATPITRKLQAAGIAETNKAYSWYAEQFERWIASLRRQPIYAVVLDYDGTVVSTAARFDLPHRDVQASLLRVLDAGLRVAFASGRGDSLHRDLRKWIPRRHWAQIPLGLHNGAWQLALADKPREPDGATSPVIADTLARLAELPKSLFAVRVSSEQVSVSATDRFMGTDSVHRVVAAIALADPALPVRVSRSAHSVDVTSLASGKSIIVERVVRDSGATLAIGDRGDSGGNDFEMLATTQWSLSVDRCSADPTRCWNLAPLGVSGPAALVGYLSSLELARDGFRFRLRHSFRTLGRA